MCTEKAREKDKKPTFFLEMCSFETPGWVFNEKTLLFQSRLFPIRYVTNVAGVEPLLTGSQLEQAYATFLLICDFYTFLYNKFLRFSLIVGRFYKTKISDKVVEVFWLVLVYFYICNSEIVYLIFKVLYTIWDVTHITITAYLYSLELVNGFYDIWQEGSVPSYKIKKITLFATD